MLSYASPFLAGKILWTGVKCGKVQRKPSRGFRFWLVEKSSPSTNMKRIWFQLTEIIRVLSLMLCFARRAGMAQYWQRSPLINITRVRFPDRRHTPVELVVVSRPCYEGFFLPVLLSPQKPTLLTANSKGNPSNQCRIFSRCIYFCWLSTFVWGRVTITEDHGLFDLVYSKHLWHENIT